MTTHLRLVLRLRTSGTTPPFTLNAFKACTRTTLLLLQSTFTHTHDNDNKSLHLPAIPVEKMYIFSGIIINLKTISRIHYQTFSQLLHSSKYHSTVISTWKLPNRICKKYDTPQKIRSVKLINCKSTIVSNTHNLNILLWI